VNNLAKYANILAKFEDLTLMANPHVVFEEVCRIAAVLHPYFNFTALDQAFQDVVKLFQGEYPGYRQCNTWYHDLKHTTDCLLAMARLMHGASLNGLILSERDAALGLIAALFHDAGYIQSESDVGGTGAKYTLIHVERSVAFIEQYFAQAGFSARDMDYCRCCVHCTGLNVKIRELTFESADHRLVGCLLGTADLLGQMADRTYLERLPFLYREFVEGRVQGFESELDLLKKTPAFWEFTQLRMITEFGNVDRFMRDHFRVWWGLDRDLTRETIEDNIAYLKFILEHHASEYPKHLRRGGLMEILGA